MRHVFHLSIPALDLERSRAFYVDILGASVGRREPGWLDILLWGHQITLQQRPEDVLPKDGQGKRHFGVVLPWEEWQELADRLVSANTTFLEAPHVKHAATPQEQAKLYLQDPGHNVLEVKAYRDFAAVLGSTALDDTAASSGEHA